MMYDGAIRHMEAARAAIDLHDLKTQNEHLQKAQKTVVDLMSCLDLNGGGEIAGNLLSLYTYVLNELVEANVQCKIAPVERSIRIFNDLRESWVKFEHAMKEAREADDQRLAS